MKNLLYVLLTCFILTGCKDETAADDPNRVSTEVKEDYEKVDGSHYKAFYGSNDQLKTEGTYDSKGKKHGIWVHYFPDGRKQSIVEFRHGLKNGYSIVYHANGSIYYRGEYKDDEMVGEWDFYDVNTGQKSHTKDYGYPTKK
ncbi:MAG TPA: hypothetical protein VKZ44_03320 [Taishania sp.]|nr:hypothetical protein [Taishania sp.]